MLPYMVCCAADCHELRSSQQCIALDEAQTVWQRLLIRTVGEALNETAE